MPGRYRPTARKSGFRCGSRLSEATAETMLGAVGRTPSGSQIRSKRSTSGPGTRTQSTAVRAHRAWTSLSTESPAVPLDESLMLADTMERLRAEWGVRYPFDPQ